MERLVFLKIEVNKEYELLAISFNNTKTDFSSTYLLNTKETLNRTFVIRIGGCENQFFSSISIKM